MKRLVAISLMVLSPAVQVTAFALYCGLAMSAPQCHVEPSCHETPKVSSGMCECKFDADSVSVALMGGKLIVAPPALAGDLASAAIEASPQLFWHVTANDSSPPASPPLTLRI